MNYSQSHTLSLLIGRTYTCSQCEKRMGKWESKNIPQKYPKTIARTYVRVSVIVRACRPRTSGAAFLSDYDVCVRTCSVRACVEMMEMIKGKRQQVDLGVVVRMRVRMHVRDRMRMCDEGVAMCIWVTERMSKGVH